MIGEVKAVARAKKAASQPDVKEAYNTIRGTLKAVSKEAKQIHQEGLGDISIPTTLRHVASDPDHHRVPKKGCPHHV